MGMTPFMTTISPESSGTYRLAAQYPQCLDAIPDSGARNPAVPQRDWVRLVVAITAGAPFHHNPYFYKCRISRMIGVMSRIVEHSGYSNV